MPLPNQAKPVSELTTVPVDPNAGVRAKVVPMPDDSMSPRVNQGDLLLFDPDRPPTPKQVVLVATPDGEHFVRMYRAKHRSEWEAVAENPGYQTLSANDDQLTIVAVAIGRWQNDF